MAEEIKVSSDDLDNPDILARIKLQLEMGTEDFDETLRSIDESSKVSWETLQMEFNI